MPNISSDLYRSLISKPLHVGNGSSPESNIGCRCVLCSGCIARIRSTANASGICNWQKHFTMDAVHSGISTHCLPAFLQTSSNPVLPDPVPVLNCFVVHLPQRRLPGRLPSAPPRRNIALLFHSFVPPFMTYSRMGTSVLPESSSSTILQEKYICR